MLNLNYISLFFLSSSENLIIKKLISLILFYQMKNLLVINPKTLQIIYYILLREESSK